MISVGYEPEFLEFRLFTRPSSNALKNEIFRSKSRREKNLAAGGVYVDIEVCAYL